MASALGLVQPLQPSQTPPILHNMPMMTMQPSSMNNLPAYNAQQMVAYQGIPYVGANNYQMHANSNIYSNATFAPHQKAHNIPFTSEIRSNSKGYIDNGVNNKFSNQSMQINQAPNHMPIQGIQSQNPNYFDSNTLHYMNAKFSNLVKEKQKSLQILNDERERNAFLRKLSQNTEHDKQRDVDIPSFQKKISELKRDHDLLVSEKDSVYNELNQMKGKVDETVDRNEKILVKW